MLALIHATPPEILEMVIYFVAGIVVGGLGIALDLIKKRSRGD